MLKFLSFTYFSFVFSISCCLLLIPSQTLVKLQFKKIHPLITIIESKNPYVLAHTMKYVKSFILQTFAKLWCSCRTRAGWGWSCSAGLQDWLVGLSQELVANLGVGDGTVFLPQMETQLTLVAEVDVTLVTLGKWEHAGSSELDTQRRVGGRCERVTLCSASLTV